MSKLIRQGECNNCGWCCQFLSIQKITIPQKDVTDDSTKFYELRNAIKCNDGKIRLVTHSFVPCIAHDNTKKCCLDYESRPEVCKNFPSLPEQIEATPCSYWFEIVDDEGNVIERRGGLDSPYPTNSKA